MSTAQKEIRALLPVWLATLALTGTAAWMKRPELVLAMFFVGSTILGAVSIGHEYSCGTLALLLSHPRRREKTYLLKLGALTAAVLTSFAFTLFVAPEWVREPPLVIVVPFVCGLFIAPWFTMICRNSLAGIVFTIATVAAVMLAAEIAVIAKLGVGWSTRAAAAQALQTTTPPWAIGVISAAAAVLSWRAFMRLEAADGGQRAVQLPWRAEAAQKDTPRALSARNPVWLLVMKELHLQQLSFVIAGLYAVAFVGLSSMRGIVEATQGVILPALTALTTAALTILTG